MSEKDTKGGGKNAGSSGRRRKAARPPTIELEAREVEEPEGSGASGTAGSAETEKAQARGKTEAASRRSTGPEAKSGARKAPKTESGEPPKTGSGGKEGPAKESAQEPRGAGRPGEAGEARKAEAQAGAGGDRSGRGGPGSGGAQLMMAAGAGAAISLVAFIAFQLMARDGGGELSASLARLASKMDTLEQRLAERGPGAAVEGRLAEMSSRAEAAQERATALAARLDSLEKRLATATDGGPAAPELSARLDDLDTRLDGLAPQVQRALSELGDLNKALESVSDEAGDGVAGAAQVRVEALASRAERIEGELEGIGATAKAADAAVKRLGEQLSALSAWRETQAKARSDMSAEIAALRGRLEALAPRVDSAEAAARKAARVDVSALEAAERRLSAKLAAVDERLARVSAARRALLASALGALEQAAASGRPFARELEAAAALMPGLAPPDALAAHAAGGVASLDALGAGLDEAEAGIAAQPAGDEGLVQRLIRSASNVVTVRRDGETVIGRARPRPLAAIAAALEQGNLDKAIAAAQGLGDEVRAALSDWIAKAKARREVLRLVAAFAAEARAAIGPPAMTDGQAPAADAPSGSNKAAGGSDE